MQPLQKGEGLIQLLIQPRSAGGDLQDKHAQRPTSRRGEQQAEKKQDNSKEPSKRQDSAVLEKKGRPGPKNLILSPTGKEYRRGSPLPEPVTRARQLAGLERRLAAAGLSRSRAAVAARIVFELKSELNTMLKPGTDKSTCRKMMRDLRERLLSELKVRFAEDEIDKILRTGWPEISGAE
jgi:hypothetical protein